MTNNEFPTTLYSVTEQNGAVDTVHYGVFTTYQKAIAFLVLVVDKTAAEFDEDYSVDQLTFVDKDGTDIGDVPMRDGIDYTLARVFGWENYYEVAAVAVDPKADDVTI